MKESEIRNPEVFNRYLTLVRADVEAFFDFTDFVKIKCPACAGVDFKEEFRKEGFEYVSCVDCSTLFVNPRPDFEILKQFYSHSPSAKYWVNDFFKPFAEARREKIFKPRAEYIKNIINSEKQVVVGDVGAGFGLFLEELRKISPETRCIAIEPSEDMAQICLKKGLEVRSVCMEDMKEMDGQFDLLTAFELLEHLFDPAKFLMKANTLLKKNGLLFITTLNCKGFDSLFLWEKSKSVSAPQHLNLFNIISIQILLKRCGFEVIGASTPGMLDWDIVEGMIKNDNVDVGRFWRVFAEEGTLESKAQLQSWIAQNNLSSHMRIIVRKILNICELKK